MDGDEKEVGAETEKGRGREAGVRAGEESGESYQDRMWCSPFAFFFFNQIGMF